MSVAATRHPQTTWNLPGLVPWQMETLLMGSGWNPQIVTDGPPARHVSKPPPWAPPKIAKMPSDLKGEPTRQIALIASKFPLPENQQLDLLGSKMNFC